MLGLLFIGVELFVLPGFGIAGVTGLALTLGSLVMASRRVVLPQNSQDLTSLGVDVLTVLCASSAVCWWDWCFYPTTSGNCPA